MKDVYLDNAATMTKIARAVQAESDFYRQINANPLRGLYKKSVQAETEVDEVRKLLLKLVKADNSYTVIFSRGTTESINLVANGLPKGSDGFGIISKTAKIVVDIESHHSNILPWKQRYKDVTLAKNLDAKELFAADVVSLTGVSNVTGENFTKRIKKVRKMCPRAILGVDAAQMLGHTAINLKELGADFVAFSGHKFGAPMGIGGLIIKKELAEKLRPLNFGGEMVDAVSIEGNPTYSETPYRLEAGTLSVGAIFGLKEALKIKSDANAEKLRKQATVELKKLKDVKVLASNGLILTFQIKEVHPHDVAQILADEGISVRAGWLCAEPFLRFKEWGPVVRASFSTFNTSEDVKRFVSAVSSVRKKMKYV